MTLNLGLNVGLPSTLTAGLQQISNGLSLQLAAGIMGQYFNPLGASPFASGALPQLIMLSLFGNVPTPPRQPAGSPPALPVFPEPTAQWSAQLTGTNTAAVDIGDGYSLQFNENSSEITIRNARTGESTQIWGDPHVSVDGKHVYDFWGTTTFTLENGTKITINTEAGKNNPNVYYASQVVVTNGSNAIVVNGVSEQVRGDLAVSMSQDGYAMDALHRDGLVLHENAAGSGWISELSGAVATQADLDLTRLGAAYGPGSDLPSLGESFSLLGNFLMLGMLSASLSVASQNDR
ncbi:DUF1521 domain-containing protein [Croceibacterium mercuriale]|uniref:DUF1521 domain-containing protein n=1 Tax=Croceibacterium mercuriale TaxID=1572751 RepID=UPI00068A3477|nr:DUF1521 domain-containing protein [Croceibacterium mercuriale]